MRHGDVGDQQVRPVFVNQRFGLRAVFRGGHDLQIFATAQQGQQCLAGQLFVFCDDNRILAHSGDSSPPFCRLRTMVVPEAAP